MPTGRRTTTGLFLILLLVLAACSSDPEAAVAPDPPAPETAPAPEPAPDDPFDEECAAQFPELAEAEEGYATALMALMGGQTTDHSDALDSLQELASAAPDEIRGDFEAIAGELGSYLAGIAELGLFEADAEPSEQDLEELALLEEQLDQEVLFEAQANIDAYFEANC